MINYVFLLAGIGLLAAIIAMIWLKDHLRSPLLARMVHSELVARFAIVGAVLLFFGLLLSLAEQ